MTSIVSKVSKKKRGLLIAAAVTSIAVSGVAAIGTGHALIANNTFTKPAQAQFTFTGTPFDVVETKAGYKATETWTAADLSKEHDATFDGQFTAFKGKKDSDLKKFGNELSIEYVIAGKPYAAGTLANPKSISEAYGSDLTVAKATTMPLEVDVTWSGKDASPAKQLTGKSNFNVTYQMSK